MTSVDVRSWAKRNMWPAPGGGLAVRPGLRRIATPSASRKYVGGFSVLNSYTGEVWHYLFDVVTTAGASLALRLHIVDENFAIFQTFTIGADVDPRVITHAVVEGEIIISGPDFPTLWGLVGSGVVLATKVDSDNPSTTALEVPRGICSTWCNRVVIADGPALFVSDPVAVTGGSPRTFTAVNQNNRPAAVYGLHEGAGGQLVALTARGVYGLDSAAAASGVVGANGSDWRMINHHELTSYGSSCVVKGRIYALSRHGYVLADIEGGDEEELDDPVQPRYYGPRVYRSDWRSSLLLGGEEGPIVAHHTQDVTSMHHLARSMRSWWSCGVGSTFRVRGVLRGVDGEQMLICEDGIYTLGGNFDGETTIASAIATQPRGVLAGIVMTKPEDNPTVRHVSWAAAVGAEGSVYAAVRGDMQSSAGLTDTRGGTIGTESWGGSWLYLTTPVTSAEVDFDINSDDVGVELAADYPCTRVSPLASVDVSASAPSRRVNRG